VEWLKGVGPEFKPQYCNKNKKQKQQKKGLVEWLKW
jgi:hypothetical protein